MDQLARDYADRAHFIFVYTREAHPEKGPEYMERLGLPSTTAEHPFPPHASIEQKYEHARTMRALHETPRRILMDDLDGAVHRAYSGCPNMSWIIDHTGRVHFKANWTKEVDLRRALDTAVHLRELKREGDASDPESKPSAYYMEGMGYARGGGRNQPAAK